jgi:hypothetical protein
VAARGGRVWWKRYLTMMQICQFWINIGGLLVWLYLDEVTNGGCAGNDLDLLLLLLLLIICVM